MTIETIKRFFNEIIFAAYLMRALPGGILLMGICYLLQVSIDNFLLSTLSALGASWGIGLALEHLFFGKFRKQYIEPASDLFRSRVPLFIALLGIALLIAPWGIGANIIIEDQFLHGNFSEDAMNAAILRLVIVSLIGLGFLLKGMRMIKKFEE